MVLPRLGTGSGREPLHLSSGPPAPFSPSLNTTLAWYDAGTPASVHHTSGAVDTLDDLSGNARHVSNTSTGRPTYDAANGRISFNGTSNLLYNSSPFLWDRSEKAVYAVVNVTASNNLCIVGETNSTSSSSRYSWLGSGQSSPNDVDLCTRVVRQVNSSALLNRPMGALFTGAKKIVRLHERDGLLLAWINGAVAPKSRSYARVPAELTVTRFCLGGLYANSPANFAAMDFYELIIAPDDSLGEQYEGYLAHKHGMTSSLPADHRYKTTAPLQGDFSDYSFAPTTAPLKVALFGDSLTAQNINISSGVMEFSNCGNFCWYNQLSNNRVFLQLLPTNYTKGVSGNTLSQMITRMATDLAPLDFDVCFFMGSTNNLGLSITDIRLQLDDIISYVTLSLGKKIIVMTVTPKTTTTDEIAKIALVNQHILLRHGSCMGRVFSVDVSTAMDDGTGLPVAGSLTDNVHYAPYGSYLVGQALDAALEPVFGRAAVPDFSAGNLLSNGILSGTGGTGTGQIATGWSLADTGPADPAATKDSNGHQLISTNYTATADTGNNWEFFQTITGGYASGDILQAAALLRIENAANIGRLQLEVRLGPDSIQTVWQAIGNRGRNGPLPENLTDTGEYLIVTPALPLTSAGITSIKVRLYHENDDAGVLTTSDVTIKGIGLFKR